MHWTSISYWNSPEQLSFLIKIVISTGLSITAATLVSAVIIDNRIAFLYANRLSENTTTIAELNARLGDMGRRQAGNPSERSPGHDRNLSAFTFEGARRQVDASDRISVTLGPESSDFLAMKRLIGQKDWQDLKVACEIQIIATPDWLTPYLFSGIARSNLGDLDGARERLEYVVARAGDDADYSQIRPILAEINAKIASGKSKN